MATFYVTHHKYPDNPQLFTINIQQVVKRKGEPETEFFYDRRGESYWEVFIATSGLDATGASIPSYWADIKTSETVVDELVSAKVKEMSAAIDWTQQGAFSLSSDNLVPYIAEQYPASDSTEVPIQSTIRLVIKDLLPGSGLDSSTLVFSVKGIPVTPTVTGHPYELVLSYSPTPLFDG